MRGIVAIFKRESSAYFSAPLGWVIVLPFIFIFNFFFAVSVNAFLQYASQAAFNPAAAEGLNVNSFVVQGVFGNMAVVLLLLAPGIAMRLLTEDRRQKSLELLLTSPITSFEIVAGKFIGAMGFVAAMLAGTLPMVLMLYAYGEPDTGVVLCNYLALFAYAAVLVASNMFLSSFTESQVIALIIGFAFNLIFWILGWVGEMVPEGVLSSVIQTIAMGSHFQEIGKGLIKAQDIVYFISFIGFCLLATVQRVESLRWR
jgi:ABC-2 type transport system permease protein